MFYCKKNNLLSLINADNFENIGGKSLGLKVIEHLSVSIPLIKYPKYNIVNFDKNKDVFLSNAKNVLYKVDSKQKFSCKLSTLSDDFSVNSYRGKNSSNSKSFFVTEDSLLTLHNEICNKKHISVKSVIFQEYIGNGNFSFLCHYDGNELIFEILIDDRVYLYVFNNSNVEIYKPHDIDNHKKFYDILTKLDYFNNIKYKIMDELGFNYNFEGFIIDGEFWIVQARPIPKDFKIDIILRNTILESKIIHDLIQETRFVFGAFYLDFDLVKIVTITEIKQVFDTNTDLLCIINETKYYPLELSLIKNRIKLKRKSIVINVNTGFLLSHSKVHIPVNLECRKFMQCTSLNINKSIKLSNYFLISDGQKASFFKKNRLII